MIWIEFTHSTSSNGLTPPNNYIAIGMNKFGWWHYESVRQMWGVAQWSRLLVYKGLAVALG